MASLFEDNGRLMILTKQRTFYVCSKDFSYFVGSDRQCGRGTMRNSREVVWRKPAIWRWHLAGRRCEYSLDERNWCVSHTSLFKSLPVVFVFRPPVKLVVFSSFFFILKWFYLTEFYILLGAVKSGIGREAGCQRTSPLISGINFSTSIQ